MVDDSVISDMMDTPLFVGVSRPTIQDIFEKGTEVSYSKDDIVIKENDIGTCFYIILKGSVLIQISKEGEPPLKTITTLHGDDSLQHQYEGDFFGEMSLIDFSPRSATVAANDDVKLLMISSETLLSILKKSSNDHISFLANIARVLSRRLRRTMKKISD